MIKDVLTNTLAQLKAEQSQTLAKEIADNKINVVNPKFKELEQLKANAISELKATYDKQVAELTAQTEAKKQEFENTQKQVVADTVNATYSAKISAIEKLIETC